MIYTVFFPLLLNTSQIKTNVIFSFSTQFYSNFLFYDKSLKFELKYPAITIEKYIKINYFQFKNSTVYAQSSTDISEMLLSSTAVR